MEKQNVPFTVVVNVIFSLVSPEFPLKSTFYASGMWVKERIQFDCKFEEGFSSFDGHNPSLGHKIILFINYTNTFTGTLL